MVTNQTQRGAYREQEERLRARREELRDAVQAGLHSMGEDSTAREVGDIEDDALVNWMRDLRVADLHHDVEELEDIEQALENIRTGEYGHCIDCGEPIHIKRLRAHPTAKRCLKCQEIYERQRRNYASDNFLGD